MTAGAPSTRKWIIVASGVTAFFAGVVWLGAPIIPAVLGTVGAGLLIYYRQRRTG